MPSAIADPRRHTAAPPSDAPTTAWLGADSDPEILPAAPRGAAPPRRFGRYLILDTLGSGGMGIVYEAYDPQIGRRVALKVLRRNLPDESKSVQRFLREAQSLAALQHPRIVAIHDIGIEGELPFISMDLLAGQSLDDRMTSGPPPSVSDILRIAAQIAEGLEQIHALGMIHRDIKPANIWLAERGDEVVLLDFGLARRIEGQLGLTASSLMIGTPHYISPEHARGEPLDARCDLFSLGVILYELTVGRKPFDATAPLALVDQICRFHPPRVSAMNAAIPVALSNLVMELLAKYPKDRPANAAALRKRLLAIDPFGPVAPSPSKPELVLPTSPTNSSGFLGFLGKCALLPAAVWAVWQIAAPAPPGLLEIESTDSTAEIAVWSGDRRVATAMAKHRLELPAGDYRLTLAYPLYGASLSETEIRVPAAGQKVVRVIGR